MARKALNPKIKKTVQEYMALLAEDRLPLNGVFVFGSRTGKQFRDDSDIDVAIVSPRFNDPVAASRYLLHKAHELNNKKYYIEPHAFHPKTFVDEDPLTWEIKQTGIRMK